MSQSKIRRRANRDHETQHKQENRIRVRTTGSHIPAVVAEAYKAVIGDYKSYFHYIEFAIYCGPRETENYEVFSEVLG